MCSHKCIIIGWGGFTNIKYKGKATSTYNTQNKTQTTTNPKQTCTEVVQA
jgi:hypothetical protein